MSNTPAWDRVPVHAWYYRSPGGQPSTGKVEFRLAGAPNGVKRVDGTAIYRAGATVSVTIGDQAQHDTDLRNVLRAAYKARAQADATAAGQTFNGSAWDAAWDAALPAMICTGFYAQDDPDISPQGYQILVTERLTSGEGDTGPYPIDLTLAMRDSLPIPGLNLASVELPPGPVYSPAPTYAKGQPGGVASLDADGDVVDSLGNKVGTTGTVLWGSIPDKPATFTPSAHDHVVNDLMDATTVGKAVMRAADTAAARLAIGLGNVNNTSDANKPVSTATAAALAAKADLVGGVIPTSQIPAVALNTGVVVADQAAMLALTTSQVQQGDIAIRPDGSWMLLGTNPATLSNWTKLSSAGAVTSVNGQTGVIVLAKADLGLGSVDNTSDANKPVSTATAAQLALKADKTTVDRGRHLITWDAGAWHYRGAVVTARPASIPAWPDAYVVWDTRSDATFVNPPPLAVAYDDWKYHKNVVPVSA